MTSPTDIEPHVDAQPPGRRVVPFAEALRFWAKLGFISFGGPAGQIAIMHREIVERRRWIGEERFLHALNYCMVLPGPEATQLAIYVGWLLHRTAGGIVAGVLFVLPSIFILLALSYAYAAYGNVTAVAGVVYGFKPVVVAVVVEAVIRIGRRALKRRAHVAIAACAFVAIYFLRVPFPLIVLAAALVGLAGARFAPDVFTSATGGHVKSPGAAPGSHVAKGPEDAPANAPEPAGGAKAPIALADDAPTPAHALPSRARFVRVLAVGAVLWALPFVAILLLRGPSSLHAAVYRFFTEAALVTFGGAYSVLAYVTQAAAGSFGWITHAQAVDGLALAETTPGPLIMVLQFVGFMAGWNHPEGMSPGASATVGALATTYATFLPCFVFIFLGAPYVERMRGNARIAGALAGVTCAVVGVVLNLALVFGATVVWPSGFAARPDAFAALASVAAFVALYVFEVDVLWVVLGGGLAGVAATLALG